MHVIIPYEPELHSLAIDPSSARSDHLLQVTEETKNVVWGKNFFVHSIMALEINWIAKGITVHVVVPLSSVLESSLHWKIKTSKKKIHQRLLMIMGLLTLFPLKRTISIHWNLYLALRLEGIETKETYESVKPFRFIPPSAGSGEGNVKSVKPWIKIISYSLILELKSS